ncbi:MAG: sigma-70 family RNA polymerase sigma factor [Thermoguttaceae bacterium]|nr:sigma-70 family RNA polymerase sigma factor [Thermoguttaceae bacterium]
MPPENSSPDSATSERMKKRLEELFAALATRLFGFCLNLLQNHQDAQDACQETCLRCWLAWGKSREIERPESWIFAVAHNVAVDMLRKRKKSRRRTAPEIDAPPPPEAIAPDPPVEEVADAKERVQFLRAEIQKLPETDRAIILLRIDGELTWDEIAQVVGLPVGTVKSRKKRILEKLRAVDNKRERQTLGAV